MPSTFSPIFLFLQQYTGSLIRFFPHFRQTKPFLTAEICTYIYLNLHWYRHLKVTNLQKHFLVKNIALKKNFLFFIY